MWILPKNISDTFHFAVDTKELGLDSEEFTQTCEKSLMWRSKLSQSPTWLRRWKRIKYLQHLSGRILKPSHTKSFLEKWIASVQVFHAPLFPKQENEKGLKTQDTSTPTSAMESEDVDQDLFSWKTSKESLVPKQRQDEVFCSMSSKTWKAWVTSQRQEYSQRAKLAHLTKEKESLSLATPQASDHIEGVRTGLESPQKCLGRDLKMLEEKQKKWPTPAAHEPRLGYQNRNNGKKGTQKSLTTIVIESGLADQENPNTTGKNQGQHLNPNWVEQLMGLPVGWTDLGSWEMESYPKQ